MSDKDLKDELERLRDENAALKKGARTRAMLVLDLCWRGYDETS
jgi:hypothetical protein